MRPRPRSCSFSAASRHQDMRLPPVGDSTVMASSWNPANGTRCGSPGAGRSGLVALGETPPSTGSAGWLAPRTMNANRPRATRIPAAHSRRRTRRSEVLTRLWWHPRTGDPRAPLEAEGLGHLGREVVALGVAREGSGADV